MADEHIPDSDAADQLLVALERQLHAAKRSYDLVVVGGSALLALGLVDRPTRDVDVVAFSEAGGLRTAAEFPEGLREARDLVARDLGVEEDWLNGGPAALMDFGLPRGFEERWTTRRYGPALVVRWASRVD